MTKYIFITGGVVSSLGKGICSASLGALLQSHGYSVNLKKLDPYLNVDPGTMSPHQHGEVFVTADGAETDLDFGHYERFTGIKATKNDSITTGQIYSKIIENERRGEYLGGTVQVIPHVTNIIKEFIVSNNKEADFVLCEIGGTVGDIEGLPYYESIRQLGFELGKENTIFIHLTYLPYISMAGELKTKPTQHSVKSLQSLGIQPNILMCRADMEIPKNELKKISLFCNVNENCVIPAMNANSIYAVPTQYNRVGLDKAVLNHFNVEYKSPNLSLWHNIEDSILNAKKSASLAIVGKYTSSKDAYKSLIEAINHAGIANKAKINITFIDSNNIREDNVNQLSQYAGIIVPGGFGKNGIEGKILAIQYARENNIPFLGICLGMQLSVIEFAQNVLKIENANSSEISEDCTPLVSLITEFQRGEKKEVREKNGNLGGTMRLGEYETKINKNSLLYETYGKEKIYKRHRHRYEVNNLYIEDLERAGMLVSGIYEKDNLPEVVEIPANDFFIATQFHPELTSLPMSCEKIFEKMIEKILEK